MSNKGILSVLATLTCLGLLSHLVLVEASQAQADGAGTRGGGDSSPGEKFIGSACVQDTVHAEDMAARYEISVEEACRRLDFQVEKIPLMRALRHDHASVFGGAWVDHDAGGVLHVAVTERSAEVETLVEKLTPAGGHVGVALVEHSEVYLNDVAAKLRDELEPWRDGEGAAWAGADVDVVGVAVDPEYNQVVLSVRPGSLERATRVAVERYGHVVSIVKAITVPGDGACTRTDCDPPLRGGIRVERRNSSSGCTLGFMAHNHASNQSHYAITAGHCAGVSEVWQHRNDDIGGVPGGGSLDVGRTDAARIHVGGYSSFSPGNGYYFYRDSAAQLYQIHYRATFGDFVKNDEVCKSGIRTGRSCGPIITINGSCCSNTVQMQVDACSDRGDSGSPVYVPNGGAAFAVAVLQGVTPDNDCHPSDNFWGSHVEYVQADLGIHINIVNDR